MKLWPQKWWECHVIKTFTALFCQYKSIVHAWFWWQRLFITLGNLHLMCYFWRYFWGLFVCFHSHPHPIFRALLPLLSALTPIVVCHASLGTVWVGLFLVKRISPLNVIDVNDFGFIGTVNRWIHLIFSLYIYNRNILYIYVDPEVNRWMEDKWDTNHPKSEQI